MQKAKMFQYEIQYYDYDSKTPCTDRGFVAAFSYGDATQQVYEYFTAVDERTAELDPVVSITVMEAMNPLEFCDVKEVIN